MTTDNLLLSCHAAFAFLADGISGADQEQVNDAVSTVDRSGSMYRAVAFAVALIIGPAIALADWDFTRWGMTVEEVQRASRFSAILNGQGSGCVLEMPGPITFHGIRFDWSRFCFDDNNLLVSVELLASANAYGAVERSLRTAYGFPQTQRGTDKPRVSWIDPQHGDRIQLSRAEKTRVTYSQAP